MTWQFIILAALTVLGALAAMGMRNLVHCTLSLVVTFAGLAGLFLQLSAEFVGLVQVLVYIGAVAVLIVFAILLTRRADTAQPGPVTTGLAWGVSIATVAFLVIAGAMRSSVLAARTPPSPPATSVRSIGDQLMQNYVLPLEVLGLLLTAALIGAVITALDERPGVPQANPDQPARPSDSASPPPA